MKQKTKSAFVGLLKIDWRIWLAITLLLATLTVYELRQNNLQMAKLRSAVYSADKSGEGLEPALDNLQSYVTQHMNTSLSAPNGIYPPIQLGYTYQRLTTQATNNVYHDAQVYCEKHQPVGYYGAYRISCVQAYIENHPIKTSDVPAGLYEFDFASPAWSPDTAGWSMVGFALSCLGLAGSFLYSRLARR